MTYVEYAVNVLGIELLPYQKDILNKAEQCKKEGKKLTINIPQRQGKALLNNCMQQKFGYDRGFKDGSIQVIRNVLASLNEIQHDFGTLEEYIDQLEASVKKEMKTND